MDQVDRIRNVGQWLEEAAPLSAFVRACGQERPQRGGLASLECDPQSGSSLERIEESLAHAYLAVNLKFQSIPLKAFLDGFEKRILVSCLRLAQGNQKNVAAVLSLKPTALVAKMRKHGIRGRRERSDAAIETAPTQQTA